MKIIEKRGMFSGKILPATELNDIFSEMSSTFSATEQISRKCSLIADRKDKVRESFI